MNNRPASDRSAVVIGAGFAGLATACLLARSGLKVTVVERLDTVGGRAGEITVDGFRFETGPSWYLMPDAFDHFFQLMGTSTAAQLDLQLLDPGYRVFGPSGEHLDIPYGEQAVVSLFDALEPGAGRALKRYLATASTSYRLALEKFLYTTFSTPRPFLSPDVLTRAVQLARWLLTPLGRYVDKRFDDYRLRQVLSYPAVFLSASPATAPSLYHLMSHTDLVQGVRYPRGGFSAVVRAIHELALANGVQMRMGETVTSIIVEGTRAGGVTTVDADGVAGQVRADIVVSGADLHHTETSLLPAPLRSYPQRWFAKRDPGLGTVLAMVGVRGELPQLKHHNLLFTEDWTDDFSVVFDGPTPSRPTGASRSIYVCNPSKSDDTVAPDGDENLFLLIPVAADPAIGRGDAYGAASGRVSAIADEALAQLGQWAGIADLRERIVVKKTLGPADFAERYHSWSGGAIGPAHTLAQSAFLRGRNASKKVAGLYYAGATTVPGVGVPMCLISAENVVKRLLGDTSPSPLTTLEV